MSEHSRALSSVDGGDLQLQSATEANQVCSRCVMDTTDPEITFDADGVCNHCHRSSSWPPSWHPDADGERLWRHRRQHEAGG